MKIDNETKKAIKIILCIGVGCIAFSLLSGCAKGPKGDSMPGTPGQSGSNGKSVVSTGQSYSCDPNTCYCASGSGVVETFYQDEQGLGYYQAGDTELNSILVCDGVKGDTGLTGSSGTNGSNGTNATPVTIVQFCPSSFVPSYPNTFPEIGFVIGGKIYAVYSANGGFLTLLTPGEYSSDGINSSCNFTVTANGTITQN